MGIHKFTIEGKNFAIDENNGVFFELDDVAEDVLKLYGHDKKEDIILALNSKYDSGTVDNALAELEELKTKGLFFAEDAFAKFGSNETVYKGNINSLCLMISQDCNLKCKYCFAESGTFGKEKQLMSTKTAKKAVDMLIQHSGNNKFINITFFGGEPLLNFEVLKYAVEYSNELAASQGKKIDFSITTNGTLLVKAVRDFINYHNINLLVSLDGPPEINDRMRCYPNGSGSYNIVYQNLIQILNSSNGNKNRCAVRGTFTRENLNLKDIVLHLASIGCKDISVEPCFTSDEELQIRKNDIDSLKKEYTELAKAYINEIRNGEYFSFYQFEEMIEQTQRAKLRVISCEAGVSYLAVSADGNIYPCHRLVGFDDYRLGDVSGGIDNEDIRGLFMKTHVKNKDKCSHCWARYICGGGCRAYAIRFNGNIYKPYSIECELIKHITQLGVYIYSELNCRAK